MQHALCSAHLRPFECLNCLMYLRNVFFYLGDLVRDDVLKSIGV